MKNDLVSLSQFQSLEANDLVEIEGGKKHWYTELAKDFVDFGKGFLDAF